jgi:hypothetical protein
MLVVLDPHGATTAPHGNPPMCARLSTWPVAGSTMSGSPGFGPHPEEPARRALAVSRGVRIIESATCAVLAIVQKA